MMGRGFQRATIARSGVRSRESCHAGFHGVRTFREPTPFGHRPRRRDHEAVVELTIRRERTFEPPRPRPHTTSPRSLLRPLIPYRHDIMLPSRTSIVGIVAAHCRAGRPSEAIVLLEALLARDPEDADVLLMLGTLRIDSDPDAAEALLSRCVAVIPGHPLALHHLGNLQRGRGDYAAAVVFFRQAAAGNPNFAPTFNDLGTTLHRLGEREAAVAAFDRAVAIDPGFTTAHNNRGLVLIELHRNEEARQAFDRVLGSAPNSADAWNNVGMANYHLGNFVSAVEACRRAIALDPSHLDAYETLAQALLRINRRHEARLAQAEWARRRGIVVTPCSGERARARILLITAAEFCNVPTEFLLDRAAFDTISLNVLRSPDAGAGAAMNVENLPEFDIAFNAIGDADRGAPFFARAAELCSRLDCPIVNPPKDIGRTRRDLLPGLLAGIPGLVVPATRRMTRPDLAAHARTSGWTRPVLLRPIGTHGGEDLVRIDDPAEIPGYLDRVPADEYYMSDFWDYRSRDGCFRKYRLIFVGREVYPYHLAIASDWLLHYWRADMTDWMKREEESFLADFRSAFQGGAADAVAEVARRIDLDYAGMDCGILPDGRVLLFEANATMLVHLRDSRQGYAYKHAHVPRIIDAMTRLIMRSTTGAIARDPSFPMVVAEPHAAGLSAVAAA